MSDRQAFIDAIKAAPDDDAPRLIFADWLDEHGEPERAEFIRVQVELATYTKHTGFHLDDGSEYSCRVCTLRCRERELIEHHGYSWCDGLIGEDWKVDGGIKWQNGLTVRFFKGLDEIGMEVGFSRGFVESVTCFAYNWIRHGDTILAAHPVQMVTLTTWPDTNCCLNPQVGPNEPVTLVRIANRQSGDVWYKTVTAALKAEWPGVRFHLPETRQDFLERLIRMPADDPRPLRRS